MSLGGELQNLAWGQEAMGIIRKPSRCIPGCTFAHQLQNPTSKYVLGQQIEKYGPGSGADVFLFGTTPDLLAGALSQTSFETLFKNMRLGSKLKNKV